ncbi:hypothetical protein UACE39S_05007 [Ureibacillus acetophenoni]|uniref:hypothetical protein n=1 Tax=Ureibacillus sp. MALMAid1270 TaxID=3411629 RepID=UPI003BA42E70
MKYFAIAFIVGVFLFIYIVFPIMDALEVPGLKELLALAISNNRLLFIMILALIIVIVLLYLLNSVKKNKYVQ